MLLLLELIITTDNSHEEKNFVFDNFKCDKKQDTMEWTEILNWVFGGTSIFGVDNEKLK